MKLTFMFCKKAWKLLSCTYCTKIGMQRERFTLEPRVAAHQKATGELQACYETTDHSAVAFRGKHQINLNLRGCTHQHHFDFSVFFFCITW